MTDHRSTQAGTDGLDQNKLGCANAGGPQGRGEAPGRDEVVRALRTRPESGRAMAG
jgi:hypothetical protein